MTAEHVVVPVEPCDRATEEPSCKQPFIRERLCLGCLGNGTRTALDQAVKVEQRHEWDPCCGDGAYGPCDCDGGSKRTWVEVSSD